MIDKNAIKEEIPMRTYRLTAMLSATVLSLAPLSFADRVAADETCLSPYTAGLLKGQEKYLQVWVLGVKGLGDESDKLVTIDVDPESKTYGKVVNTVSVGGRGEAHHMGFTDDRKYLWAGRLDDSKIFIFDVGTDPAKPTLVNTISNFAEETGFVGPHTFYALPGRMLVGALSNTTDHGGRTGLAIYSNAGKFLSAHPMPTTDGGKLIKDEAAMKNFGKTMVMWNLKSLKPDTVFDVPGAPLEIRWSLNTKEGDDWAVTAAALTSKLWLINRGADGKWQAKAVADIGDPAKIPLPVDISIAADGKSLWVNTFMDGMTRLFDLSNPEKPVQVYEKKTGSQVNMVSQSWDGKRVYITSSLLANWDKKGADDEQFLKAYGWNGKELVEKFEVDFYKEKLGRAHHMKFTGGQLTAADYPAGTTDPAESTQ
jgi:methanethiol oxidase